ncbi:MAG TPA: threonine synthase, partial [Burkholderiales bacterium]
MRYVSTRGGAPAKRFTEILLEGLASDGGLYVPETFPRADLKAWRGLSYPDLAFAILSQFMGDVPGLKDLVRKTYTKEIFGSAEITPLKTLEPGLHL